MRYTYLKYSQRPQRAQRNARYEFSAPATHCLAAKPRRSSFLLPPSALHRGISLIEVLISMFVLLFGLMGVAAIFPVGNYYVVQGEQFDLGSSIAQNAFEELSGRGMLDVRVWQYADTLANRVPAGIVASLTPTVHDPPLEFETQFIQPPTLNGGLNANQGMFNLNLNVSPFGPGHAFVLDPLGAAADPSLVHLDLFPRTLDVNGNVLQTNLWSSSNSAYNLSGERWPVRRLTLLDATGPMTTQTAETIFRLRDDLAVDFPDESDQPSRQRWDSVDLDPTTGSNNNTPNDPSDDTLLRRQYVGNYSWLATIVPVTERGVRALQPANADYGEIACDVSVVVFRKRDETPSATSERMIAAELSVGGELVLFEPNGNKKYVEDVFDEIRPGNWIALMGVNSTTGDFVMKWYRLLSLDQETIQLPLPSNNNSGTTYWGRRAMIAGPDWPAVPNGTGGFQNFIGDLRAAILPGVVTVVTKPLRMEDTSLWKLN